MDDKIVLKGIFQGLCKCGKCNVSSYPGRIYGKYEWSCVKKSYILDPNFGDKIT